MDAKTKKQMSLGVVLSYVSIAAKLASGLIYAPIMLHSLGQSQYGVYSLCTSFIGYLTILNAGVNAAYIRFYVQKKTQQKNVDQLNGLFCRIFIIISVVAFVGGLLIAQFSPIIFGDKITVDEYELVRRCFVLLSFVTGIEIFTCVFKSFITANEQFIYAKSMDIFSAILYPLIATPLLLNGADCTGIVSVHLGVSVLILVVDWFFCRKKLNIRFIFDKAETGLMKDIGQFIGFIVLQSIMDQFNWQIDKFILARTQGTSEISIYSVGSTFNGYFMTIGAAVSSVFIAEINRVVAVDNEERLNDLFRRTCKLFTYLIGYVIIAFFIFGRPFILRWAGTDYGDSFNVAWMLMAPVTFSLITGLGQDISRAKNKHQIQIAISVGVCIINALVSIPLAIHWGAVGSAFGTFMSEIIICVIIQPIYYSKVLRLNMKNIFYDFVRYFPGVIVPVCFGLLLLRLEMIQISYSSVVLFGIVYTAIYAVSIWAGSMNKDDRQYILKLLKWKKA